MNLPAEVITIAEESVREFPNDAQLATEAAEVRIRQLKTFKELIAGLLRNAIQNVVYDVRHRANVALKRERGDYGTASKVPTSESVREVNASVYSYYIAGRTIGMVLGKELGKLAASQAEIASGHHFNAELCRRLQALVKDEQTVQDAVSEKKLRRLFDDLQGRKTDDQAA